MEIPTPRLDKFGGFGERAMESGRSTRERVNRFCYRINNTWIADSAVEDM
jgi:hypothetical protein